MGVRTKSGRPIWEADLDWQDNPGQEIYDQFYEACRGLNYLDMRMLAKAFRLTLTAVVDWKSGRRFPPGLESPLLLIRWVERGKPLRMRTQADIAASMLLRKSE